MKNLIITLVFLAAFLTGMGQSAGRFDIFSYATPAKFVLKEKKDKLFLETKSGKDYCQLFLYPARTGTADIEKDFVANWNFFARNPSQGVTDPETKEKQSQDGWDMMMGSVRGSFNKKPFVISLTTITRGPLTYYTAAVFTSEKYIPLIQEFMAGITPDTNRFVQRNVTTPVTQPVTTSTSPAPGKGTSRRFRPSASEMRRPEPYSNAMTAASRAQIHGWKVHSSAPAR